MTDTPTPRTDDYCEPWTIGKTPQNFAIDCESGRICLIPDHLGRIAELIASAPVMARRIEQLERELADAREAYSQSYTAECARSECYEQQRDRLAEGIRLAIQAEVARQHGATISVATILSEALAAVEGGES